MAKIKRKDLSGWGGFLMLGLFIANCYFLNKLLFFIPEEWGWMNEAIKLNDTSDFMPLRTALCLTLSLPLTLFEVSLYFRFSKKRKA